MVVGERYVVTDEEWQQERRAALFAYEETRDTRKKLVHRSHSLGAYLSKLGTLLLAVEENVEDPLHAESELLMLQVGEHQGIADVKTIKALANSIAASRREFREAAEAKRKVGFSD